jgi:hypothetical protein
MTKQETLVSRFVCLMRRDAVSDDRAYTSPKLRSLKNSLEAGTGPVGAEHPGTIPFILHLPIILIDSGDVLHSIAMRGHHLHACEALVARMFT